MAARKIIDWEEVEREYRAGQLSISEISRQHDISRPAIIKKAQKNGWKGDLSDQVRKEINAKLVTGEVTPCNTREAIDNAVNRGIEVVRGHQKMLSRLMAIGDKIMDDLEHDGEEGRKSFDARERADLFRSLGQVLAKAIPLERQAFNLDKEPDGGVIVIDCKPAQGVNEDEL